MDQPKERPQMFVVQIWPLLPGRSALRGSVEHIAHRRPIYFSSYDQLVSFIQTQLDEHKGDPQS